MELSEIGNRFTYHTPKGSQPERYESVMYANAAIARREQWTSIDA